MDESKEWVAIGFSLNRTPDSPPILVNPGSQTVTEGDTLSFTITATDPDGAIPSLTTSTLPANASFTDNGNGTGEFTFVPDFRQAGTYNVSFIASDGELADTMIVTIIVQNLNHAPALNPIGSKSVEIGKSLHFNISATDPDGTTPALSALNIPPNATFIDNGGGNGSFDFAPDVSQVGVHLVTFIASDGTLADSETVSITVVDLATLSYIQIERLNGTPVGNLTLTTDIDTTKFYCRGYTSSGALIGDVAATWSIIGVDSIGTVETGPDAFTMLILKKPGTGKVVASYTSSITDTTGIITSLAGVLARLQILPDSAIMRMGDTVRFAAQGYDADGNSTQEGNLTWRLRGRVGEIDDSVLLTADYPGRAYLIVSSDINGVSDTSQWISVEELYLSTISLGNSRAFPGQWSDAGLAFRIDNYFDVAKAVKAILLRKGIRGAGTIIQRRTDVDSAALWVDSDDDSILTASDSLITKKAFLTDSISLTFADITLPADGGKTFFANFKIDPNPHDGDSVDLFIRPGADITSSDGTIIQGPDSANSYGYCIIDGMISNQVQMIDGAVDSILPGEDLQNILAIDIPQNGFMTDTLKSLTLVNIGSAIGSNLDSIQLFADDGDGLWNGKALEILLGQMEYTGNDWKISGLNRALHGYSSRFFIAVSAARFQSGSRTIAFQVPINGIEVASNNDGPLDNAIGPVDTVIIQAASQLQISAVNLPVRELVPGEISSPILHLYFENGLSDAVRLDSLTLSLDAVDPAGATQSKLDSQIDSLLLYHELDRNDTIISPADSLLATAKLSNGKIKFRTSGINLPGQGGTLDLSIAVALDSRNCKNGNTINIKLEKAGDIYFSPSTNLIGSFPIKNDSDFTINTFPASAVIVYPVEGTSLFGGMVNQVVFDFRLFGNGYAPDYLKKIKIGNKGSLNPSLLVGTLKLWTDNTSDGFTSDDRLVSSFTYYPSYWQIDNLHLSLDTAGRRFIVTLDIAGTQFEGGSLLPSIPVGGLEYSSGTVGPDDASIESTGSFLLFPSDRITAISIPMRSDTIPPGAGNQNLLTFALYNGYVGQNATFQGIGFTNASQSQSILAFADSELGQISLYYDNDSDRVLNAADSLIGTGYFSNGKLQISGFNTVIPYGALSYFFLTADLSYNVIDGDIVSASINSFADLQFSQDVNIDGDMPLARGGQLMLDGSVEAQYQLIPLLPKTVSPGDSDITLLAFRPANNGDQIDYLTGLTIANILDADSSDILKMDLWQDADGDSIWEATDLFIAQLDFSDGLWSADNLNLEISGENRPLLYINADISPTASTNSHIQVQIPVNGCQFASTNDGPYDATVNSGCIVSISGAGIRINLLSLRSSYTVGQSIPVRFTVANLRDNTIDSVLGMLIDTAGTGTAHIDSAQIGPVSLASGESIMFSVYFKATTPGQIGWDIGASYYNLQDSAPSIRTPMINIQSPSPNPIVRLTSSMPTGVIRGQTNIFPLSLDLANPGSAGVDASLIVNSLQLSVTNESMQPQNASEVFSRLVLSTGYTVLATIDSIPASSDLSFAFDQPMIIPPGSEKRLIILADIDSTANSSAFAFALSDSNAITFSDANTLMPVSVDTTVQYPLRTASCRITDPSRFLGVSIANAFSGNVNKGQYGVELLKIALKHPGTVNSSPIQLTGLSISLFDDAEEAIAPYGILDAIEISRGNFPLVSKSGIDLNSLPLRMSLNSPLTINPGQTEYIYIKVTAAGLPVLPSFRLVIADSSAFTLRDLNSGSQLYAATDSSVLATGSVFPISTGLINFKSAAESPKICLSSALPLSIIAGVDSLSLGALSISYPYSADFSPVRIFAVKIAMIDTAGHALNSDLLLDRIGYKLSSQSAVSYQNNIEFMGGSALFRFGESGILLNSMDSQTIQLVADIEPDAPTNEFSLLIESENSFMFRDATDSANSPAPALSMNCTSTFPFILGPAKVLFPAGRPTYSPEYHGPKIVFPTQSNVSVFNGILQYGSVAPVGDLNLISISGRILQRAGGDYTPVNAGNIFSAITLLIDNSPLAVDTTFENDSILLSLPNGFTISKGLSVELDFKCSIKSGAPNGNYIIRFSDSTFIYIVDKFLDTRVYPNIPNQTYPLASSEIVVSSAELGASFSNYPNPFMPSRGEKTKIAYVLSEDARVDLQVYSITGESVNDIIIGAFKSAGSHQEESWNGTNSSGQNVLPGTYICRITARYNSGRVESFKRKVSVIR